MSKRRHEGDRVWKQSYAGFVMQPGWVTLSGPPDRCVLNCDDDDCQEWPNALTEGSEHGSAYHLSECELFDSEEDERNNDPINGRCARCGEPINKVRSITEGTATPV